MLSETGSYISNTQKSPVSIRLPGQAQMRPARRRMLLPPEIPELRFPAWSAGEGSRHPGSVGAFSNAAARWASRQPIKEYTMERISCQYNIDTVCENRVRQWRHGFHRLHRGREADPPQHVRMLRAGLPHLQRSPGIRVKLVRSEAVDHNLHKYDDDSGLD